MECELCSTAGQGGATTRCPRCGFDTTLPPDVKRFLVSLVGFRPGELLDGRYRIDRILGYGGMSVVYKARDEVLGEEVAIKVLNRGRMGDDNKLVTDIKRDIVTTRKLAHPDIVKIYDFHKTDVCGFLTMEFVPGKDLASLIVERGRLGEAEVCRIAAQVAEALHYAHTNGVIHCDIKPANLLLTENGRVKIADFGISRVMHEESSGLTGLVVGTPAYMAPEQIRGERPGPRTDMYALGIVMWHCLMGSPPYTRGDISYQHVHEPLPPLTGVSPDVERVVRRAASKAVDDRFPTMAIMARELQEILRNLEIAAADTLMRTPPPDPDETIVQAPRSPAGTPAQAPPPVLVGTSAQALPTQQAGTVVQTPAREPAPTPERPPSRQPERATPTGADGRVPPASGGPGAGKEGPLPTPQPATPKIRTAAVAAVVVLLAGAAAWGVFFRSAEPIKTQQPELASGGGLPPALSPPSAVATAPPPERPAPGAALPAPPRQAAIGAGSAGAAVAVVNTSPSASPPPPVSVPIPRGTELQAVPPAQTGPPEPGPAFAAVAPPPSSTPAAGGQPPVSVPPPVSASIQPTLPVPPSAPVSPPVSVSIQPTPPIPPSAPVPPPAPGPTAGPSAPEPVQAKPAPPPAARVLDLTPIQVTALPRGRWCDVQVRAVGTGLPLATARSEGERRLSAERSAELDAYRRIAENVKGLHVSGGSTVKDFVTTDAGYRTKTDAVIRGARRVDSQKNADGTWSVVMELNLSGMCDIIEAGTP